MTETEKLLHKHRFICECWCVSEGIFQARVAQFASRSRRWIAVATGKSSSGAIAVAVKRGAELLEYRARMAEEIK